MSNLDIYYAVIAPKADLFEELSYQDVIDSGFGSFNVQVARFNNQTTLSTLKQKILKKWQEEAAKNATLKKPLEKAILTLQQAVHAYIVLEDTAKMLLSFRKGYLAKDLPPVLASPTFAYLQMLRAASAPGSYVQIFTEGRDAWINNPDERLQRCAKAISKDNMIYERLSPKVLQFWKDMNEKIEKNTKKK